MGLDMYLTARRYFWSSEESPKIDGIPEGYNISSVNVDAGYWRKANAIHQWFVENCQDGEDNCRPYTVSREDLEKLRNLCMEVLDGAPPEDRLPTTDGFFFGNTEYGDWYYQSLRDTVATVDKVLVAFPEGRWEFIYQASW